MNKLAKSKQEVRMMAVCLSNNILDHKDKFNDNMTQEILQYLEEKLGFLKERLDVDEI